MEWRSGFIKNNLKINKMETNETTPSELDSMAEPEPRYTAAQILAAAEEGEVNHFDAEHIVKILKEMKNKN